MILTIPGNVPSQKNRKRITKKKDGTHFLRSDKVVLDWKEMAVGELSVQFMGLQVSDYPIMLTLEFWFDNLRRHDLDNAAAGVMDALSAAGVIVDDNVKYVDRLLLKYGGHDKTNPRVEITLED